MSHFHRSNLFSGIRESHQVPIQADWAFAIRKQARMILLPLFREVIVGWRDEKTGKRPFITELADELFQGFYSYGGVPVSMKKRVSEKVLAFIHQLSGAEQSILKFYFISGKDIIEILADEDIEKIPEDPIPLDKLDRLVGKTLKVQFSQFSDADMARFVADELHEIENILSDSDLEIGLDTEAITRINESFSNYLDLPYGEISLIQKPIDDWDFWEKVTAEEPETVGKKFHTSKGLEWAECWLLPNGEIKVKGNLEDPADRDKAAILAIREELSDILRSVHKQLKEEYELLDNQIHYTFFTRRKSLENILIEEGIEFFKDQIDAHESDDFEPMINIDIQRYSNNDLEKWGTQIRMDIDSRYWLSEDQTFEFKVWVLVIENEETALETRFNQDQKRSIIQEILKNINTSYQLKKEA